LDVKGIVLPVVVSDSLGDFIEPPLLLSSVLSPSLQVHLGVSVHLSNSVEWKLRDNVEWSVNVESKFFIKSLGFSLDSINITNLPSLVCSIVSVVDTNSLSFFILISTNVEASVSLLDVTEMLTSISEDLEPS